MDFARKFQEIIDNYNAGGSGTENVYEDLVKFAESLKEEDERHIREGLSEDELELFYILKQEKLTKGEEKMLKLAAKALLSRLLEGQPIVLIRDWHKDSQSQARVRTVVEEILDKKLPESYDKETFQSKCRDIFELIHRDASEGGKWAA